MGRLSALTMAGTFIAIPVLGIISYFAALLPPDSPLGQLPDYGNEPRAYAPGPSSTATSAPTAPTAEGGPQTGPPLAEAPSIAVVEWHPPNVSTPTPVQTTPAPVATRTATPSRPAPTSGPTSPARPPTPRPEPTQPAPPPTEPRPPRGPALGTCALSSCIEIGSESAAVVSALGIIEVEVLGDRLIDIRGAR